MSKTFFRCIEAIALLLVSATPLATLHAQSSPSPASTAPASLQEQLEAQYQLTSISTNGGCKVSNPETALVIRKNGVTAFPESNFVEKCSTHYKNGRLTRPDPTCMGRLGSLFKNLNPEVYQSMAKRGSVALAPGEQVFPLNLDVNAGKGEVRLAIGYCSSDNPPVPYKGQVIFQLPVDTLKSGNVNKIEDTILEVFSQPVTNQQSQSPPSPSPDSADAQQTSPANPKIGQTVDEVVAALGEPDMKAEGSNGKLIYVWKADKIKITFIQGKVADID